MGRNVISLNDRRGVILNLRIDEMTKEIKEALKDAVTKATNILYEEIVNTTPVVTEESKKHIYKKVETRYKDGSEHPATGSIYSKSPNDFGILGFVLRGTAEREQSSTGRRTGRMIPNNYWREAADNKRNEMIDCFEDLL